MFVLKQVIALCVLTLCKLYHTVCIISCIIFTEECFWELSMLYVDLVHWFSKCALGIPEALLTVLKEVQEIKSIFCNGIICFFTHILVYIIQVPGSGYMAYDIIDWKQKKLLGSICSLLSHTLKRFAKQKQNNNSTLFLMYIFFVLKNSVNILKYFHVYIGLFYQ